jgi:hypothetical protein
MLAGYAEALGGAKAAAMHDEGDIDPSLELIARRPAIILSGLFGGFLVVGSLPKTSAAVAAAAPAPSSPISLLRSAAPGIRRHRHRGDTAPIEAGLLARPVRPQPPTSCDVATPVSSLATRVGLRHQPAQPRL